MAFTIITENDISQWNDETGSIYHFPKKYLKHLQPGTKIIYYKGRIKDNSYLKSRLSKDPHYFGFGEIGNIWKDGNNEKNYFAEIINYIPFTKAVSFKVENGSYIEIIPQNKKSNYWRDGVRSTSKEVYHKIISLAENNYFTDEDCLNLVEENILKPYPKGIKKISESKINTGNYNINLKSIGDKGENHVLNYLKKNLTSNEKKTLKWHANIGETPGYDISFYNNNSELIAIEVKSTTGKVFKNFIMTINEINAAKKIKENYFIYLVSDCMSKSPKLNILKNPTIDNNFNFEPVSFNVSLHTDS
ncbi:DUF3883 domain-containing protein [Aureivirga sp. CE67]|uniref:DUF3883 domain-containing protein n=1 Tax=Aureivirga sp. CE67 TaxID=1788983 RepID=UPI0018C8F523|nr:DUF3883 domain-containing protein [Aureivirga sp. CE67]